MKKNKNKKYISLIVFVLLIVLVIFLGGFLRNTWHNIFGTTGSVFWKEGKGLNLFFQGFFKAKQIAEENQNLKLINLELMGKLEELKSLKKENIELRKALDIGLQKEYKLLESQIIGLDQKNNLFFINKGKEDGIKKDMVVITSQKVLIGMVDQIFNNYSVIKLITHPQVKFVARTQSGLEVVVKGDGNFKLVLENFPKAKVIQQGEKIFTSTVSKIFPRNLLIGEVKEIFQSDIDPNKSVVVSPFFAQHLPETIFVILNWN
ncbi:rod shape-determining protein MreC [bacterium]|nr:rod shape-determining protein MreC [bacterium]